MLQDLRFAARQLWKNPGFSVIAVLTVALAIGANTAIFSAIDTVLLHPLPYPDPDRLVIVQENLPHFALRGIAPTAPNYAAFRREATSLASVAAVTGTPATLTEDGAAEEVNADRITASAFAMLGVAPLAGALFTADDEQRGRDHIVLISESLWTRRYGRDPAIVGRNLQINRESYRVVGVIRPILDYRAKADLWMPLWFTPAELAPAARPHNIDVIARLKPAVTLEQARDEFRRISAHLVETYPQQVSQDPGYLADLEPLARKQAGDLRTPLLVLAAAVGALMLIACVNVSNLLLARAVTRRREMSIRAALGASRAVVIRQLLTESLLLALVAGAAGGGIAFYALRVFTRFGPAGLIRGAQPAINLYVIAFSILVSIAASVLFGLAPALEASRVDLAEALKEGSRGSSSGRRWLRESMVSFEVAASLVLLIGAGLLVRSFALLERTNPGFRSENVLIASLSLPAAQYQKPAQRAAFMRSILERVRAIPGVASAAVVDFLPYLGGPGSGGVDSVSHPRNPNEPRRIIWQSRTSPGFFTTMGIPLLRGRDLSASDELGSPSGVVIDELAAKYLFGSADPIGQQIFVPLGAGNYTVTGVVGATRSRNLAAAPEPRIYYLGPEVPFPSVSIAARAAGDPKALVSAIRSEVRALDSGLPLRAETMEEILADSLARQRFSIQLMSTFAALAALLAAIGIYGVCAYLVDQRHREIGIRVALGARRGNVLGLILRQGSIPVAMGVIAGIAGAFALTRLLKTLLYEVSATDPIVFAAVPVGLMAVAFAAMWLPARRATLVDPLEALREE